ncbi:MAG: pilin [Nitrospinae bacterium]|nr:pilin [Nitrospinota bacterium]
MMRHFRGIQDTRGFTLVELLIVISVIGILAVIGLPQYGHYRARAFDAKAQQELSAIITGAADIDPNNITVFNYWQPSGPLPDMPAVSISPDVRSLIFSYDMRLFGFGAGVVGYSCHLDGDLGFMVFIPLTSDEINWGVQPNLVTESAVAPVLLGCA